MVSSAPNPADQQATSSSSSSPRVSPVTMRFSSPTATRTTTWSPAVFLDPSSTSADFALLILNQPVRCRTRFLTIFLKASLRVCADGGANALYNLHTSDSERTQYLPHCIIGDLDSISSHVRSFYAANNVPIIKSLDQISTDFGKALGWIDATRPDGITVVAHGGFGGRIDQSFHSIHALYYDRLQQTKLKPKPALPVECADAETISSLSSPLTGEELEGGEGKANDGTRRPRQILLLSSMNLTMLMEPGRNVLELPKRWFGKTCGLLPVGQPAVVTTRGLEWDITDQETRFGGLVSTSNHLVEERVEVETDVEIVFTLELREAEGN